MGMRSIIGCVNEVSHGTWESSNIMGHGIEGNHWTWECSKIMGH